MIIFLHGKEKYLVFQRYFQLKKEFHHKNEKASIFQFDGGEDLDLKQFASALSEGGGLFSEKKMIVLKDIFASSLSVQKSLSEIIEQSSIDQDKEIFLVVAELHSSSAKGKLLDLLKKKSKVEQFDSLSGRVLEKWIAGEFSKRSNGKVEIENDAVKKIIGLKKGDLWAVSALIDSLLNYCAERITLEDVLLFGEEKVENKIFDLVDAMGQRNISKALRIKQHLLAQGENEFLIFSMLVSQLRNLLKVNEGIKKGMHADSIASSFGMHPFVVKKTLAQLRGYDKNQLKVSFLLAADIDKKTKIGDLDMSGALDYLIAKI